MSRNIVNRTLVPVIFDPAELACRLAEAAMVVDGKDKWKRLAGKTAEESIRSLPVDMQQYLFGQVMTAKAYFDEIMAEAQKPFLQ